MDHWEELDDAPDFTSAEIKELDKVKELSIDDHWDEDFSHDTLQLIDQAISKQKQVNLENSHMYLLNLMDNPPSGVEIELNEEAVYHRIYYTDTKAELVEKLFKIYNKHVFYGKLPRDRIHIIFNNRLTAILGKCIYSYRQKTCLIKLSDFHLTSAGRLIRTFLHELMHAANHFIDKVHNAGHGLLWKKWVCKAKKIFPHIPEVTRVNGSIKVHYAHKFFCRTCGKCVRRAQRMTEAYRNRMAHRSTVSKCCSSRIRYTHSTQIH